MGIYIYLYIYIYTKNLIQNASAVTSYLLEIDITLAFNIYFDTVQQIPIVDIACLNHIVQPRKF